MMVLTSCRRPVRHQTGCPTPMTASELFADIVGRSVGFHRFNAVVSTADGFVHLARANDLTIFSLQCEVGLIRCGFQPFIPVVCRRVSLIRCNAVLVDCPGGLALACENVLTNYGIE